MPTSESSFPETLAAAREMYPATVQPETEIPDVSLLIPALNEARYLPQALREVYRSACRYLLQGGSFEMVVIDNGSTDETPRIAEDFGAHVVTENERGHAHARNAGIAASKGRVLLWTDADTVRVHDDWVTAHMEQYRDPAAIAVSGPSRLVGTHWSFGLVRRVFNVLRRRDRELAYDRRSGWEGAGNVSYRKDVLSDVGVYDPEIKKGEDIDLWKRLKAHAATHSQRIVHDPENARMLVEMSGRRYDTLGKVLAELWMHLRQMVHGRTTIRAEDRR